MIENRQRPLIAQRLDLFAVAGNVPALFNLQPSQRHPHAAGPVGQRIRLAAGAAVVHRLRAAQLHDPPVPQRSVFPLRAGQVPQHLRPHRVRIAVSQRLVGVVSLNLGLPVAFQSRQYLLQPGVAQHCNGHSSCLLVLL